MKYTPFLNLFEYDPSDTYDANSQFLIQTALNDNWDKIDSKIEELSKSTSTDSRKIGDIIIRLTNETAKNEVVLNGALVYIEDFYELFKVYRYNFGTPDDERCFYLPDLRNMTIWGVEQFLADEERIIKAGLPNIIGAYNGADQYGSGSGAFTKKKYGNGGRDKHEYSYNYYGFTFDANNGATKWNPASAGIYGGSTTVQPPAMKVRFLTRYK